MKVGNYNLRTPRRLRKKNDYFELFFTGFLQVFFVAANTYFISERFWIGIAIAGFLISFIWSFNVKKIAFGNMSDRVSYSFGAMCGGLLGVLLSSLIV